MAKSIIETRKQETHEAITNLGILPENIHRLEIPDFSGLNYLGMQSENRSEEKSTLMQIIRLLRKVHCTRILIPNSYREHIDHYAASLVGIFDAIQAGEPVCGNLGEPQVIKSYYMYSVWGAFSPFEEDNGIIYSIGVQPSIESQIRTAIRKWKSQEKIIESLLNQRQQRFIQQRNQFVEIYIKIDPRPILDYNKYKKIINQIKD
jgi:hypothetical protein